MATDLKDKHNVSERDFQNTLDESGFADETRKREKALANPDDAFNDIVKNNFSEDEEARLKELAQKEDAPTWKTNINPPQQASTGGGNNLFKGFAKKSAKKWIIGGVISAILALFGLGVGGGSLQAIHLLEMLNRWDMRIKDSPLSNRAKYINQKRYFTPPSECKGGPVKCRLHRGLSDNEIEKLTKAGLSPDIATDENGKKYVRSFTVEGPDGKPLTINNDNFFEEAGRNPHLVRGLGEISKARSIATMGVGALRKIIQFRINVTDPLGNAKDEKSLKRAWRQEMYGQTNLSANILSDPAASEELQKEATQEVAGEAGESVFDKPIDAIPNINDFDVSENAAQNVMVDAAGGGLKASVFGIASAPDKVCSAYDLVRGLDVGAKIYKSRALIRYAFLFLTIASQVKSGDAGPEQIGLLMNLASTPSVMPSSKGKVLGDSAISKVLGDGLADPDSLARTTNGGTWAGRFTTLRSTIDKMGKSAGINPRTDCRFIKGTFGQIILGVVGLATSIGSFGTLAVVGIVGGTAASVALSTLGNYVVPMLQAYLGGRAAPDPDDPEGGFGMGNAIVAGVGAFGAESGRANGLRPVKKDELSKMLADANAHEHKMALIENRGKNPFDLNDVDSIASKLAMTVMPRLNSVSSSAQTGIMAALAPWSLVQGGLSKSVYAADDDPYGTQYCRDDDIEQLGLAADMNCNILYSESSQTMVSSQYDPDKVTTYMIDNGYVDPETGAPIKQEYKNFRADCIDDVTPILADGGGVSVENDTNSAGGQINTTQCLSTGEKETNFRMFQADGVILKGQESQVAGVLGKETGLGDGTAGTGGSNLTIDACNGNIAHEDNIRILCESLKYDPFLYQMGAGHCGGEAPTGGLPEWKERFLGGTLPGMTNGLGILDCSSLVRVAIWEAFGTDVGCDNVTGTMIDGSKKAYYTQVPQADGKPGDIVVNSHHTGIIINNNVAGRSFTMFNAYGDNGVSPENQIGKNTTSYDDMPYVLRYTGPKL